MRKVQEKTEGKWVLLTPDDVHVISGALLWSKMRFYSFVLGKVTSLTCKLSRDSCAQGFFKTERRTKVSVGGTSLLRTGVAGDLHSGTVATLTSVTSMSSGTASLDPLCCVQSATSSPLRTVEHEVEDIQMHLFWTKNSCYICKNSTLLRNSILIHTTLSNRGSCLEYKEEVEKWHLPQFLIQIWLFQANVRKKFSLPQKSRSKARRK